MTNNNFGLNNSPLSFRVLRTEKSSSDIPTPQDPKLAALAQSLHLAGPTTPTTPTDLKVPGSATDLIKSRDVGVNKVLGRVQSLGSKVRSPLNDLANASRQAGRTVRDAQGIIQQGALIKQDFNNAVGEAKKLGQMLGILSAPELSNGNNLQEISAIESSKVFNRDRIAWTLTTQANILLDIRPIQFFVNPNKAVFGSEYAEALEFVQSGNFYTRWRSQANSAQANGRAFPNLGIQFTFQSSNILPETHSVEYTTSTDTSTKVDGQLHPSLKREFASDVSFETPPGIKNFYDILSILNQPTTLDGDLLASLSDADKRIWDGQPNFAILRVSTRTFPLLTAKGFFQQGWSLDENAENPLAFDMGLKFIAFESDPPWWDHRQILDRYNDIYRSTIEVSSSDTTTPSVSQTALQIQQDIKDSSRIDQETLDAASDDSEDTSGPTKDAPDPGDRLANVPSAGFGDDTQAQVALGNIGLRDFTDTRSPAYNAQANYNVARVGDKVQTTLQLPSGENYVQYQSPNGTSSTTFTSPTSKWTSYTSAPSADGTRSYSAVDGSGNQFFTSRH